MTVDGRVKGPFDSQEVPEFRASGTTRDEIKSKAEQHIRNCGDEIIRLLRSEKRIILNNGRR